MDDLRAQARHARQRYDLYKAKAYGPRPTSDSRMRELQRECESAQARLSAAKAQERAFDDAAHGSASDRTGRAGDAGQP
jgi:hypothetical protein